MHAPRAGIIAMSTLVIQCKLGFDSKAAWEM